MFNKNSNSGVSDKTMKPTVTNFVCILMLKTSIFWDISSNVANCGGSNIPNMKELQRMKTEKNDRINKYKDSNLIDTCIVDNFGHSLYHIVAFFDDSDVLKILLDLDNDVLKYKTSLGNNPLDIAKDRGNWCIVKRILLAKMGNKMKSLANETEKSIISIRSIAHHIVNAFVDENEMEIVLKNMIHLISNLKFPDL